MTETQPPTDDLWTLFLSFSELKAAEVVLLRHPQGVIFSGSAAYKLSLFKTMHSSDGFIMLQTKILNHRDYQFFYL